MEMIEKSVIQGAITSAITCYWLGNDVILSLPFTSYEVPCWGVGAVLGVASSLVSDAVHYVVKEEIPLESKVNDMASNALGIVSSGVVFNGVLYALYPALPSQYGVLAGMVSGAIAEYGASFTYNLLKSYSVL